MGLEKLIESQIQEAMAAGAFANLEGAGKPLPPPSQAERMAGDNWLGFKILRNAELVPEWLGLGREIEQDIEGLARIEARYGASCLAAMGTADGQGRADKLAQMLREYEELARAIRKKQERFNQTAPGPRSQRPALWVEYHLERLRRMAPPGGLPPTS